MTPASKRHKTGIQQEATARIAYPNKICLPSKATLRAHLENSLADPMGNQSILQAAGILSIEEVLLPAIALHEEAALKGVQAKIQRDQPEHKAIVEAGRRLIRTSIRNAIVGVQASRRKREENQVVRRQEAFDRALEERKERQQELAQQRKAETERQREEAKQVREQRFRNLQRQYPRNKDLWKEIVVLTRSRTQLEKEERLWVEAKIQQQEYLKKCDQQEISMGTESDDRVVSNAASSAEYRKEVTERRERADATIKDIVLASKRIQQGLGQVLLILKDSETARKQLYKEYRRNHQFMGYQGVCNPKGLIRLLSQDD
jgi:hypothetical protein